MGNHHSIIFVKEIDDFTLYLTGPTTIDELVDNGSVMNLMELKDELEAVVRGLNQRIDEAAQGLDPYYY